MIYTSLAMAELVVFPMLTRTWLHESMNEKKQQTTSPIAALIQQVKIVPTPT
jgi:hypothetical protein